MEAYTHRKAAVRLQILDKTGTPLKKTSLRFEQTGHRFLFGCGAFDTMPYANGGAEDPFCRERTEGGLARQAA